MGAEDREGKAEAEVAAVRRESAIGRGGGRV